MGTYADMIAKHSIPYSKKYELLTSHFSPGADYNFPQGANKRKFQYKWLCEFKPWLVYSVKENGGFCLPCCLFATSYYGTDAGILVRRPLLAPPFSKSWLHHCMGQLCCLQQL